MLALKQILGKSHQCLCTRKAVLSRGSNSPAQPKSLASLLEAGNE